MSKAQHILKVAEMLKEKLPDIVTQEELMNCYLHVLKIGPVTEMNITVKNLIQAAVLADIKVEGHSKLEINVTLKEQLEYIRSGIEPTTDRESTKRIILSDKEKIIALYYSGYSPESISKTYGCCNTTMKKYLKEFGIKLRRKGWRI